MFLRYSDVTSAVRSLQKYRSRDVSTLRSGVSLHQRRSDLMSLLGAIAPNVATEVLLYLG